MAIVETWNFLSLLYISAEKLKKVATQFFVVQTSMTSSSLNDNWSRFSLPFNCKTKYFKRKNELRKVLQFRSENSRVWQHYLTASFSLSKTRKINHFLAFFLTFVQSKYKRSSLRSQCWMRLFLWFSNTILCCCIVTNMYMHGCCTK